MAFTGQGLWVRRGVLEDRKGPDHWGERDGCGTVPSPLSVPEVIRVNSRSGSRRLSLQSLRGEDPVVSGRGWGL